MGCNQTCRASEIVIQPQQCVVQMKPYVLNEFGSNAEMLGQTDAFRSEHQHDLAGERLALLTPAINNYVDLRLSIIFMGDGADEVGSSRRPCLNELNDDVPDVLLQIGCGDNRCRIFVGADEQDTDGRDSRSGYRFKLFNTVFYAVH
ncbi:MAG: hypothetical protein M3Y22_07040 [Pseudomonadota bacterium]|nr:hypothetical protein [Pseudomonadota bacterium]